MERKLRLEVSTEKTFSLEFSRSDRALILSWVAETSAPNIVWMRLITIKWRWPPIMCVTCFTDR
jgi:hypothetical protein